MLRPETQGIELHALDWRPLWALRASLPASGKTQILPGAVALWNGSPRTRTLVISSQLTAAISAADLASAGSETFTVQNPGSATSSGITIRTVRHRHEAGL